MSESDDILDIVAQTAGIERHQLTLDTKLSNLNVSSLDALELIFELEDKFHVELPYNANVFAGFETVGEVVAVVEKKLTEKRAAAA